MSGFLCAFSFALFFLFCLIPKCQFLFYLVICYYYFLEACLFSNETERAWIWMSGEELGVVEGGETAIRIYYVRGKSIFTKGGGSKIFKRWTSSRLAWYT